MERVALITGGSRGIGLAIAQAFIKAGINVVIGARNARGLEEAAATLQRSISDGLPPTRVDHVVADVKDQSAVDAMVDRVLALHGRLDILVNNAGRGGSGPTAAADPSLWYEVIDTNLHGVYRVTRAALLRGGHGGAQMGPHH